MSDLPRILPTSPGAAIRPVQPSRKSGREPKRPPHDDLPEQDRDDEDPADESDVPTEGDDLPGNKGSSINLRV